MKYLMGMSFVLEGKIVPRDRHTERICLDETLSLTFTHSHGDRDRD